MDVHYLQMYCRIAPSLILQRESSGLSVSDAYLYDDGDESSGNDTFAREPYVIRFNSSQTVVQDFVLIPCHTAPHEAVQEIDHLFDVYQDAVARWGVDDVMVLGDLNADCRYVTSGEWDQIRLWTDPRFTWLIGSDATTDCAYDRFVVAGDDFVNGINASSVSVFNYKDAFNITQDLWPLANRTGSVRVRSAPTDDGGNYIDAKPGSANNAPIVYRGDYTRARKNCVIH
ncbi:DNASE1 [Branchiostoma lanceolatum]|uniref:DNASE1 protein n=1 Tax=Branchiostoma lanceolatum TaxID=7740 RepID=A0A8K0AB66_BRALA|nr:DNASE1 [Branchiostoma lanceolatum]